MKLEITNVSYSTALTYELVIKYDLQVLGAPTFPSLREEAFYKADAKKPTVLLFMQYKLAEHFIGNASSLRDYWGVPYFRFLVHPKNKSKNHQLLIDLEAMNQLVYYTAPEMHTMNEFYKYLAQQSVLDKSTFWSPREIGAISENERYTVSYKSNMNYGVLQPGKKQIDAIKGDMLLNLIKHKFESNQFDIYDDEKLFSFGDQMLENYLKVFSTPKKRSLVDDIRRGRERVDPRDYLSLISIFLYDCYLYTATVTT
jgi:hypothetical protein